MLPIEYKARYESIMVPLKDGTVKPFKVYMYRLRSAPAGIYGGYNEAAMTAFMTKLNANGIDNVVRVDTDSGVVYLDPALDQGPGSHLSKKDGPAVRTDSSAGGWLPLRGLSPSPKGTPADRQEAPNDMHSLARYVFAGKGAPEHCQIVLQLAHKWDLAPDPQAYADAALGLDCNGFVGNYLWHGKRGKPWTDLGIRNMDLGPDATIDSFFPTRLQDFVATWSDLDGSKMYVMGMVNGNGDIIQGGGAAVNAGHITITQPGFVRPTRTSGRVTSQAIYVVESTAGHTPGLWQSFYSLQSEENNRVFNVRREEMTAPNLKVKIAEVK